MKKVIWLGNSRRSIQEFPSQAQDIAGHELLKVQLGKMPSDWKAMTSVGPGAIEIRIHHPQEHRVIYVANFPEAVYILHCFGKKTQKTLIKDLDIARIEYAKLEKYRQQKRK
jgi:phage-related protein